MPPLGAEFGARHVQAYENREGETPHGHLSPMFREGLDETGLLWLGIRWRIRGPLSLHSMGSPGEDALGWGPLLGGTLAPASLPATAPACCHQCIYAVAIIPFNPHRRAPAATHKVLPASPGGWRAGSTVGGPSPGNQLKEDKAGGMRGGGGVWAGEMSHWGSWD